MKPREYCCCAIPVVNAGIYATLITQFVTAFIVGILSVATPSIVGAATPSYSAWILAVICFVAAALQILGFIGVGSEKPILFRRYVSLHLLATLLAFAVAAAWIIMSATRHTTAKAKCLKDFFSDSSDGTSSEGDTLCEIFPWVDVGIMGGLWAVLGILHIYLYVVLSSYGTSQRRDHEKYDQLNNETIPMNSRGDPWDSRPSMDGSPQGYSHVRQESAATVSEVLSQPQLQPKDSLSHSDYSYRQDSYPPPAQERLDRNTSRGGASVYPRYGYGVEQASQSQYHDPYDHRSS
ncbi:hypothetical protein LshimejAT787_0305180 [Lyophyllum shimeji]|uniref:Uncharacterized protein n=1 Tax=Lyophyllum shimeji TaxID=47721 RepID=A0A9P3PHU4_LYOSH|nr:hypothetical protein LshimejAT787_0305180 [Lyophyllum shimeji]